MERAKADRKIPLGNTNIQGINFPFKFNAIGRRKTFSLTTEELNAIYKKN
jgi:hypothetical protein